MNWQTGFSLFRSTLSPYGREAKRAWLRISLSWQALVLLASFVLTMPVLFTPVNHDEFPEYLTTGARHGPNWLVVAVAGLLIVRFCILILRLGSGQAKMKRYLRSGSKELAMTNPDIATQVQWLETIGVEINVLLIEDAAPNAAFLTGRQQPLLVPLTSYGRRGSRTTITFTTGLIAMGLAPEELRALVADGAARGAFRFMISGTIAQVMFSFMAAGVGVRTVLLTANRASFTGIWFILGYGFLTLLLQFLFVRWATLIGNDLYLLADSMAVKLTNNPKALAMAIKKVEGAMKDAPQQTAVLADFLFVPPDTGRRLVPVPWNFPAKHAVARLLRKAETLVQARVDSLDSIASGYWLVFGGRSHKHAERAAVDSTLPPAGGDPERQ